MIESLAKLLELLTAGNHTEADSPNVQLKRSWHQHHGHQLCALANRATTSPGWMCIGVENNGALSGHSQQRITELEQQVSDHINQNLDPHMACRYLACHEVNGSWVIVIQVVSPGCVVYWNKKAFKSAGTSASLMTPAEEMALETSLPGLTDLSAQEAPGDFEADLVTEFVRAIASCRAGTPLETITDMPLEDALKRLGIHKTGTQRALFGGAGYRIVTFDRDDAVITNDSYRGLYRLLRPEMLSEVQEFAKQALGMASDPYPARALKECLANAVAHASYHDRDGDLILELYPDRVCISNLCPGEVKVFANKWFSRAHLSTNPKLMETLRLAGCVEELGRGKNLICAEMLRAGKRMPKVELTSAGRSDRWRLILYGGESDEGQLELFESLRAAYVDVEKALIAHALVHWHGQGVEALGQYVDKPSEALFAEVLSDHNCPVFLNPETGEITLRRWVKVLIGEPVPRNVLSVEDEANLFDLASRNRWEHNGGQITPRELRVLAALGNTGPELALSSGLLRKWVAQGKVRRVKKGVYELERPISRKRLEDDFLKALRRGGGAFDL